MSKKKKKEDSPFNDIVLAEVFKVFNLHPYKNFNYKQVFKLIRSPLIQKAHENLGDDLDLDKLNSDLKSSVQFILNDLRTKEELLEVSPGKFKLKPKHAYMEGVIDITASGAAYLLSENDDDDVYIAPRNVKNALHRDRVRIYLYARHKNQRLEGAVTEVLERSRIEFAGKLQITGKYAFVLPDSNKMLVDIFIPRHLIGEAQNGQKVVAEIVEWPPEAKNPIGKIVSLLGWPGENDVEMNSILSEYGFPLAFPDPVEKESEQIPTTIPKSEIGKRRDFRSVTTFTIDPHDAKDFDDALSIKVLSENRWEIGVHIADVSHYVRPTTLLDKEAYFRATSVYLVDRVIPMLPEKLSNGVCSLRPNEDKLCFSAVFEIDSHAKIHNVWFGKTIIHSDHRFAYEEAQDIIENGTGPLSTEVLLLNDLAVKLRKERFKKGAVAFEKMEVKFRLDESGKPIGVYLKESKDANKLIEEFMLLANRSVAERVGKMHLLNSTKNNKGDVSMNAVKRPFVYRVHDGPVQDRIQNFTKFANRFGYKLNIDTDREIAHSLNDLMKNLQGKKEQNVLEQLAIRTMSKAIYTTENIGHYGLAFEYYTHFTSPIRRYPDVLVHRLLQAYLESDAMPVKELLEEQCKHSTQMEIKASEAERASIKYKQVEFLLDKVGEVYDGLISGVTEWGLYVEIIENKCEGMIRLRDIDDDFYEFDDTNYCVIGSRTRRKYTLGDSVKVQILRCDLIRKQIDMRLVNGEAPLPSNDKKSHGSLSPAKTNIKKQRPDKKSSGSKKRPGAAGAKRKK
ncbi:MAG TPA: ribonuclease R [Bacteroidia bacterium]|nr:ribonuclease R [Bacteroidia bacterium]